MEEALRPQNIKFKEQNYNINYDTLSGLFVSHHSCALQL